MSSPVQWPSLAVVTAALFAASHGLPRPDPHGSGWTPSGTWSPSAAYGHVSAVSHVSPVSAVSAWPSTQWTDYNVGVDPWATQKARYQDNPAALWGSSSTASGTASATASGNTVASTFGRQVDSRGIPTATSTSWYQRHHNNKQAYQQPLPPIAPQTIYQSQEYPGDQSYQGYHQPNTAPQGAECFIYEVQQLRQLPQEVKKKSPYASLYPWVEKPVFRGVQVPSLQVPLHPGHSGGYAGWSRIPVLDDEDANKWVAWVPEEFGDFVIVRKDKIRPKKNKKKVEVPEEEEEEEEPEPPKPKKKVKTTVEEEAVPEEPPKPKKKVKTTVEEEAVPEEPPKPKKKVKTTVEEEAVPEEPPKKTTKTVVTTEESKEPPKENKSTVTKTEVIQAEASTVAEAVSAAPA